MDTTKKQSADWVAGRAEGVRDAVKFVLSHYEQSAKGPTMFTPVEVDPETWWSGMILTPKPKYAPRSQEHFEARIRQWQKHAYAALVHDECRRKQ